MVACDMHVGWKMETRKIQIWKRQKIGLKSNGISICSFNSLFLGYCYGCLFCCILNMWIYMWVVRVVTCGFELFLTCATFLFWSMFKLLCIVQFQTKWFVEFCEPVTWKFRLCLLWTTIVCFCKSLISIIRL